MSYFDLHTAGLGYVNRIREVKPRKGTPFLACDIVALHGDVESPEKVKFDCKVTAPEAEKLIRRCWQAVDQNRKVLIGFRLGDLWVDTYVHTQGAKAGQTGVSLKARLIFVSWIKIDGELVYKAAPRDAEASEDAVSVAS